MEEKVKSIISKIFNVPIETLNNDSSPDNVENWDSFNHLNLILALEEEFNISFNEDQIINLLSLEIIVETIKEMIPEKDKIKS